MSFGKLVGGGFPRRLWGLAGFPGSGKSTFAARMRTPILAVDADGRFGEVAELASEVLRLSDRPADNSDVEAIADLLNAHMPETHVGTVVVDSLTSIVSPLVVGAIMANDAGRNKNRMAAFKDKALALRLLQDSVTAWGTDCLWIWHLQTGRDSQAAVQETATISPTELARLTRSLNLMLRVVIDAGGRRGVHVDWARRGRSGVTVWDPSGTWAGIPEDLERAVYGGLTPADQEAIALAIPASFAGPGPAISWGFESGAFKDARHAVQAYNRLKEERQPANAAEMWRLWISDVTARKLVMDAAPAEEY